MESPLTEALLAADLAKSRSEADRMFRWLLLAQWGLAVIIALALHIHVWGAVLLGGALCVTPLVLVARMPGWWLTRHVIAATQMLFSALLIHVTGGRIETHFHVFGSLAILAIYRDWTLLANATLFVAGDHLLRGMLSPQSVYGVLFANTVLVLGIAGSLRDRRCIAQREATLTEVHAVVERQVAERTAELHEAHELESIGRLAAGVAHGINTPLQYIGNNVEFLGLAASRLLAALEAVRALGQARTPEDQRIVEIVRGAKLAVLETRLPAAIAATHDGLHAVERIVGTLRHLTGTKGPTAPTIAIGVGECLTSTIDAVRIDVPMVPIVVTIDPTVDAVLGDPEALGQALGGLVRNAVEACIDSDRVDACVRVAALRRGHLLEIHIHDEGRGIPEAIRQRIFDPFFTTKGVGHGCGEGLHRIRDIIVGEHGGELSCQRSTSVGTTFVVRLAAAISPARVA